VVATLPPLRETRREQPGERLDRTLQREHLVARRVHEVDVFGQWLAQRARHRVDAAVRDQAATDLLLHHAAQVAETRLELLAREPLPQRVVGNLSALARLAEQAGR